MEINTERKTRSSVIGLLIAIFWLVLCDPSAARIGETVEQTVKRYGHCLKTGTWDDGTIFKVFSKSGFKIFAHFYEKKVDEMGYFKDTDMTEEEMKALMQDNAPGEWVGIGWPGYSWRNQDLGARYSPERHQLIILTDAAYEREKKKDKDVLNGL
jgi:hypothetical protein